MTLAYVYVRRHYAYDLFNACKFGITTSIPNRDIQYATGEIQRGIFDIVIEMSDENSKIFEKMFQNYSIKRLEKELEFNKKQAEYIINSIIS